MTHKTPIPVSVIGGFLGAGKTTLVNRLLAENAGRRLGVIVNDFGEINIDEQLIVARNDDMVSLANGCICCSIGSDFLRALVTLVTRPDPPEHIVIEASGVADPMRIAALARADKALSLFGILVLVDACSFEAQRADPLLADTLEEQVKSADLLVLTKTDISKPEETEAVTAALRTLVPEGRIAVSSVEALPVGLLFNLGPRDDVHPAEHHHDHGFWSGTFESATSCDLDALRTALGRVPASVLRIKGFVRDAAGRRHTVQWVGGRCEIRENEVSAPAGAALVYIGVGEGAEAGEVERLLSPAFQ
ncbi:MAG: GTP-binding protein [Parvibaculaceae bacterium]